MPTLNRKSVNTSPKTIKPVRDKKKERQAIYQTARWKAIRQSYLLKNPLCEKCLENNIITPADDIHHIDSFMNYDGLTRNQIAFDYNNLKALCKQCHQAEHNKNKQAQ